MLTEAHIEEAREQGRQAGRHTGSWAADDSATQEHIAAVLKMLADGDPQHDDYLPRYPTLSGEYADDPTPGMLGYDILDADSDTPGFDAACDELADAWEVGAAETFYAECEHTLRGFQS